MVIVYLLAKLIMQTIINTYSIITEFNINIFIF